MHELNEFGKILINIKKRKSESLLIKVNETRVIFKIPKKNISSPIYNYILT